MSTSENNNRRHTTRTGFGVAPLWLPAVLSCGFASVPAFAANWVVSPSVSLVETFTDNVNLAPSGQAKSDFVTELTPRIDVRGDGARVKLNGSVQGTAVIYGRESSNDRVVPQASLVGNVEAIERFFFVEAAVNVSQSYLSAVGPQQFDNVNVNNNRYTYEQYRLSPYIQGVLASNIDYSLRSDNAWTDASNVSTTLGGTYNNHTFGSLSRPPAPLGWRAQADSNYVSFPDQPVISQQFTRADLVDLVTPELEVFGGGGYEWNRFSDTSQNNITYGVGGAWRPSPRTQLSGDIAHRFFGISYRVQFDHRQPRTAFTLRASRDSSTYPQNFLTLPAGGDLTALLDSAFSTRITDPLQRQQAVNAFLRNNGLPSTLASPVNFFSQQLLVTQLLTGTVTLIGARNTLALTVYQAKNEAASNSADTSLPIEFFFSQNNTQRGLSATFTHQLSALTTFNLTATRLRAYESREDGASSMQTLFYARLQTPLGPKTNGFVGARYQIFRSNTINDFREAAALVGVDHRF